MKKALVVCGGWDGHEPDKVGAIFTRMLEAEGFEVELSDRLEAFFDADKLAGLNLLVPHWTMGELPDEAWLAINAAVRGGVGIAGIHGGMGDAFRTHTEWQFMVGGQWVAHPDGIIDYRVNIVDHDDPITTGLSDFDMHSEQYYMHVDPSNKVLSTTTFGFNGCVMPVVWKRTWGKGRVFFSSCGHVASDLEVPEVATITQRGFAWAAAK